MQRPNWHLKKHFGLLIQVGHTGVETQQAL
jgi:hypothetical protein